MPPAPYPSWLPGVTGLGQFANGNQNPLLHRPANQVARNYAPTTGGHPANWDPWSANAGTLAGWGASPDLMRILQGQYQPHQFPEHERTRQPAFLQGSLAPYLGQATLTQLLLGQGKTDPQAFNRQLSAISQGNNQQQGNVQAILAQRGLGGSGVGQALGAAVGQAGQAQLAGARANEAQMTEQRKRDDLGLLLDLIVNPSLNAASIGLGQGNINQQRSDQIRAQKQAGYGDLIELGMQLYKLMCWVAEEVFHNADDEDAVRLHMATDPALAEAYLAHGKELAFHVRHEEAVRRIVVPRFHEFADHGYSLVG